MKLSVEEVVKLIESCNNAGVTKLKWGKLVVSFGQKWEAYPAVAAAPDQIPINPIKSQISVEREIEEDPDLRDLEMASLLITDEEAYEEELRKADYAQISSRIKRDVPAG